MLVLSSLLELIVKPQNNIRVNMNNFIVINNISYFNRHLTVKGLPDKFDRFDIL